MLVNDLDLRIIGPGNTVYQPWILDPADPAARAQTSNISTPATSTSGPSCSATSTTTDWPLGSQTTTRFGSASPSHEQDTSSKTPDGHMSEKPTGRDGFPASLRTEGSRRCSWSVSHAGRTSPGVEVRTVPEAADLVSRD